MKKILLLFLIAVLSSCSTKKKIFERNETNERRIKTDTIIEKVKEVDTIYMPSYSDFLIENPCDSVTGRLKDLHVQLGNSNSRIEALKDENGNLKLKLSTEELRSKYRSDTFIKVVTDTIYKEVFTDRDVEIVKYRTAMWARILIIVMGIIIYLLIRFKR